MHYIGRNITFLLYRDMFCFIVWFQQQWLAIGFNEAPTMGGADVYQAMLDEKGAPHARNGDAVRGDVNQYADQVRCVVLCLCSH